MKHLMLLSVLISGTAFSAISIGHADLKAPDKKVSGHVQITTMGKDLRFVTQVNGLRPGSVHGFHIHENGKCEGPDFKSAGGHLNPEGTVHAAPTASVRHMGDLGNLVANEKGIATKEVIMKNVTEAEKKMIIGKAFILHEKADDFSSQPSGNAGKHLACGIIEADATR